MGRIFLYFTALFLANSASCQSIDDNQYPHEIKKLGIEKQFDKSKWFLYCIHCDQRVIFTEESGIEERNVTFGQLDLKFHNVKLNSDTIEINFYFYYKEKRLDYDIVKNLPYWGVVYTKQSDSVIKYSSLGHIRYHQKICNDINDCPVREIIPLQPEVKEYIIKNKSRLAPWFRQEAIKRGVIKL